MRAEHDGTPARHLRERLDEHSALSAQSVDDELVMDDFVAYVDRRSKLDQRLLDDRNRAIYTCAEAPGIGEKDIHGALVVRDAAIVPAPAEGIENDEHGADGDGAVGDIEGGIVPVPPMKEQEVNHVTERNPVQEIADGSAEDQSEPRAIPPVAAATQQPDDQDGGNHRDGGEKIALPTGCVAQKAERRARIEREHETEEVGEGALLAGTEEDLHRKLRRLVDRRHADAEQQPQPPPALYARRFRQTRAARHCRRGS